MDMKTPGGGFPHPMTFKQNNADEIMGSHLHKNPASMSNPRAFHASGRNEIAISAMSNLIQESCKNLL
jgi:hypothetical protein